MTIITNLETSTVNQTRGRGRPKFGGNDRLARDRILQAAAEAFTERGFDGVSVPEIAKRAEVTHPLVHYHFSNKLALWQAVVDHLFAGVPEVLIGDEQDQKQETEPLLALQGIVRRISLYLAAKPALVRFVLHEGMMESERLVWLIDRYLRPIYGKVSDIYQKGVDQGTLKPLDYPLPTQTLSALTIMVFSQAPLVRAIHNVDPLTPEYAKAHSDAVVSIILSGFVKV